MAKKIVIQLIELIVIALCLYGINYLVVEILNPDYTIAWENYKGPGITPNVENSRTGIMRNRQFYRAILFFIFSFLIIGYYFAKKARAEMKKRKITTPYNIVQSNRKVVALRGGAFLFILLFAICFFSSISSSPMKAMTENGVAITNPLFGNDGILKIIMCLYFPVCFTIGPYVLFKGLTNVFTLKSCLAMLLTLVGVIVAFIVIIELFDIKYPQAAVHIIVVVICGLNIPVLVNYARKMNEVATVLGINNTVKNKQ